MENFKRVVNLGVTRDSGHLWARIEYNDGKLSITGVEGPTAHGHCRGARGQIIMHEWYLTSYGTGWDANMVAAFRKFWDDWHLNDCTAGSPKQEAAIKEWKAAGNRYEYSAVKAHLEAIGLHQDATHMHLGEPYRYGSAWLFRAVPEDVLQWLRDLPEPKGKPASV